MRRGFAFLFSVTAIGLLTPAAFGQYTYPYGPMPAQYGPMPAYYGPMPGQPYGYPPMPAYIPNQMMPQPMYYPPPAMGQYPPNQNTKVFVYGPLEDPVVVAPPNPLTRPLKASPVPASTYQRQAKPAAVSISTAKRQEKPAAGSTGVQQTQGSVPAIPTNGNYRSMPTYSKADIMPDSCGPGCNDCAQPCGPECGPAYGPACGPACRPGCDRIVNTPPMRGCGHFIGEIGVNFLVPYFGSRQAYSTTTAGGDAETTGFNQQLDIGSRATVGYIFHTGWGLRGNYSYLQGVISTSAGNASPTTTINTPLGLPLASPGPALAAGIGADGYTFSQRLYVHVADAELVKEASFLDTSFLLSFGARYANMLQSYSATRANAGGIAGGNTFALDRVDGDISNRFEGLGPTVSFEAIHPLGCGFAIYGNARGSFLWGTERSSQNTHTQLRTVDGGGVATFTDTSTANTVYDNRYVSIGEAEAGLQFGCRVGRCYIYTRAGAVFQRWWDVGNPTSANGSINFIGGTARMGISF